MSHMSEPSHLGEGVIGPLRPAAGLSLLGEYQGGELAEPRFMVRRSDGQIIQLPRLLYLVAVAITEVAVQGNGTAAADVVAEQVSPEFGQEVTAANVRYMVATKLAPLGVVTAQAPATCKARRQEMVRGHIRQALREAVASVLSPEEIRRLVEEELAAVNGMCQPRRNADGNGH